MGVLDNSPLPEVDPSIRTARQLKMQAKNLYQQLVQVFNQGAQNFWKNPRSKPSEIAAVLGTDAKELFELHAKIGALIDSIDPTATQLGKSAVGQFTYNEDGSVTPVDPVSEVETPVETPVDPEAT